MRTAVLALTLNGSKAAFKIGKALKGHIYVKQEFIHETACDYTLGETRECQEGVQGVYPIDGSFTSFVGRIFYNYEALIFIMASGIAVRAIAPYIKSKTLDPAVVVCDEKCRFSISLLSGHVGGANALAAEVAGITGGTPVITTATDVNNVIAFDVFAVENNCSIENMEALKHISSALVNGKKIPLYTDCRFDGSIPEYLEVLPLEGLPAGENEGENNLGSHGEPKVILSNKADIVPADGRNLGRTLFLRPKNLVIGIGCRRGTLSGDIKIAVEDFLHKNNKSIKSVRCMATIDLKRDEAGLLDFCSDMGLQLKIVERVEVKGVEHKYSCSGFVKEKAGVGAVAEPCSILAGNNARLVCQKTIYKGITLALSEEEMEFYL